MHPATVPRPDTVTLYPGRGKWIGILLSCAGVFAFGVVTDVWRGWIGVLYGLFLAAGTTICVVQLTPGGAYLKLTPDGFVFRTLLRTSSLYRWREVSEFRAVPVRGSSKLMVVFDCPGRPDPHLANLSRLAAGAPYGLPDNYGMSHQALAALMNRWRSQAMR